MHARSGRQQTRLATRITTIPRRLDLYFADNMPRQALWSCISYFAGFYAANTGACRAQRFPDGRQCWLSAMDGIECVVQG